ncbi:hypothetical protein A2875_04065 [Candidatus Gottesmanbacteria bacterium RIFCSPHIGHO2_01_FULL_46_14]|uniref:Uncharacterized protein n=2 Tax=Candidatus Gottesmaniibacteriota TaxID=1752720 RepID=A0A1F5ZMI9_9BACT|nr:MAG: hypothetical protein A2875_04065 [Candidatus Gottesmanbacteria bacterium RIFCSPHIGHO2_01_FULL_46_14]OGG29886.1 MAG: hypothetical protein A2971_05115 [Candidatus Gottesmanbacteria bacterium RIFCSPLOWO2_01_FULL_46_21]
MRVKRLPRFDGAYLKLSPATQKKVEKTIMFLVSDLKYPSLRVKKMQGVDAYEARVDIHYRLTFGIVADVLELYTVGMHDTGLGKK